MPAGGKACTKESVEEGEGGAGAECGGLLGRVLGEEGDTEVVQRLRRIRRPLQRRSAPFLLARARARAGRRLLGRHGIQARRARTARRTGRRRWTALVPVRDLRCSSSSSRAWRGLYLPHVATAGRAASRSTGSTSACAERRGDGWAERERERGGDIGERGGVDPAGAGGGGKGRRRQAGVAGRRGAGEGLGFGVAGGCKGKSDLWGGFCKNNRILEFLLLCAEINISLRI